MKGPPKHILGEPDGVWRAGLGREARINQSEKCAKTDRIAEAVMEGVASGIRSAFAQCLAPHYEGEERGKVPRLENPHLPKRKNDAEKIGMGSAQLRYFRREDKAHRVRKSTRTSSPPRRK